jgi:hypothetical protein
MLGNDLVESSTVPDEELKLRGMDVLVISYFENAGIFRTRLRRQI